jgi:cyclophilin family peptidyl-prolyl cis-trans isomerase
MNMRTTLAILLVGCVLLACGLPLTGVAPVAAQSRVGKKQSGDLHHVVILKTTRGDITLHFFPEVAPIHVKSFLEHCKSGLYTGCSFHRILKGSLIQSGDPLTKDDDPDNDGRGGYGYKGPGTSLPAEFSRKMHLRGTVSMARGTGKPDSAGSQFFMMMRKQSEYNGDYTVFAEVIDGIEVVDLIGGGELDGQRPVNPERIENIVIEKWSREKIKETMDLMWKNDRQ